MPPQAAQSELGRHASRMLRCDAGVRGGGEVMLIMMKRSCYRIFTMSLDNVRHCRFCVSFFFLCACAGAGVMRHGDTRRLRRSQVRDRGP